MREFEENLLHYYPGRRRWRIPWFALACLGAAVLLLAMIFTH